MSLPGRKLLSMAREKHKSTIKAMAEELGCIPTPHAGSGSESVIQSPPAFSLAPTHTSELCGAGVVVYRFVSA